MPAILLKTPQLTRWRHLCPPFPPLGAVKVSLALEDLFPSIHRSIYRLIELSVSLSVSSIQPSCHRYLCVCMSLTVFLVIKQSINQEHPHVLGLVCEAPRMTVMWIFPRGGFQQCVWGCVVARVCVCVKSDVPDRCVLCGDSEGVFP